MRRHKVLMDDYHPLPSPRGEQNHHCRRAQPMEVFILRRVSIEKSMEILAEIVGALSDREMEVFYAVVSHDNDTDAGKSIGLSRSSVGAIYRPILRKIRAALIHRGFNKVEDLIYE